MANFMSFFDVEYLPKLGIRSASFRAVMREAYSIGVAKIVETGSIRVEDNWAGDGQSTIIFNAYTRFVNGTFDTIDINENCLELTKNLPNTNFFPMDSVKYLSKRTEPIDLLYLDSFDVNMSEPHDAAMHCMFEFCAAQPKLHSGSIVFIDDSPIELETPVGGKGVYVAKYFAHLGIPPFVFGYQTAWKMP